MEKTIGQRIRECRIRKGMTQEELAEVMLTKKATISAYELDKIDMKISVVKELTAVLDTSVAYLTGETELNLDEETMKAMEMLSEMDNPDLRRVAVVQIRALMEINEN